MKRLVLAFLLAPLVPAAAHAALTEADIHPLALFVVVAAALYLLELVIGIPAWLILRRFRRSDLGAYALLGFCVGAVPLLALSLGLGREQGAAWVILGSVYWGLLGAATTVGFWFVARPDRQAGPARAASA